LKKFKSIKYGSLKKYSPLGHLYRFTMDKEIPAVFEGIFYQEDEDWMMILTSFTGNRLLEWTNPTEDITKVIEVESEYARGVLNITETRGFVRQDILPDLSVGKTKEQIDIEVDLAIKERLQEDIEAGIVKESIEEPIVEPIEVEIKVEEALMPEPEINSIEYFKNELKKSKNILDFISDMKLEFNVDELEGMCADLGLEYIKPKAKTIQMLIEKLGE